MGCKHFRQVVQLFHREIRAVYTLPVFHLVIPANVFANPRYNPSQSALCDISRLIIGLCLLDFFWTDTLHVMNVSFVESRIASLDSFSVWQSASSEQQTAFNDVPFDIDANNPKQLRQQLSYLEAQQEQQAARQALMTEIASQEEDFLPVAYWIGTLAAFQATDKPPTTKYLGNGRSISTGAVMFNDTNEHTITPSSNPVILASQVGDELERLGGILDTSDSVPVVMVWHRRYNPPRLSYDEVVTGELPNPRDKFALEAPKVEEIDGQHVPVFTIPSRFNGVVKGRVVVPDEYIQPEEKYKSPVITTLARLGVVHSNFLVHDPDALYIGSQDVTDRVAFAERDRAEYLDEVGRLKNSSFPPRY